MLAYDFSHRKRLEVRIGAGLSNLRVSRWLSATRRHLGGRAAFGVADGYLVILVVPQLKTVPEDLPAALSMLPVGMKVTWFDEIQMSLMKRVTMTGPPFFKFTLKDTTRERLVDAGPAGVVAAQHLIPRRVRCLVHENEQNYLFLLRLEVPSNNHPQ